MKKYLVLIPIIGVVYFATARLIPNMDRITVNSAASYKSLEPNKWPWFGINLNSVQYQSDDFRLTSDNIKLELNIQDALFGHYLVHKIIIEQPKIKITGSITSWNKAIQKQLLPFQKSFGKVKPKSVFKISVHDANIMLGPYNIEHASIHTTDIQKNNPFSVNIEGIWQEHPIKFSALVTKDGKNIKLENTHLTFNNMS